MKQLNKAVKPRKKVTRELLLEAACDVFAQSGYYNAKVSDICDAAGANVSAVNYYFQSKENLYLLVWDRLWSDYYQRFSELVGSDAPVDTIMLSLIRMNIQDSLNDGCNSRLARLIYYENSNPSPMANEINNHYYNSIREQMRTLMSRYFGCACDDATMTVATMCIREPINGLIGLKLHGLRESSSMTEKALQLEYQALLEHMDILEKQLTNYIIGGLQALRKQ